MQYPKGIMSQTNLHFIRRGGSSGSFYQAKFLTYFSDTRIGQALPMAFWGGGQFGCKLKPGVGRKGLVSLWHMKRVQNSSSPQKRICLYFRSSIFFTAKLYSQLGK